jgi:choice-of-anchor A domain-containing protein
MMFDSSLVRLLGAVGLFPLVWLGAIGSAQAVSGLQGPAADYNVFVFDDLFQKGGDFEGKLAVGGNANLDEVGVAAKSSGSSLLDSFVVGGNLTQKGGQVYGGNATVGGTVTGTVNFNCAPGCQVKTGSPIDFGSAKTYYKTLSTTLQNLPTTGSTSGVGSFSGQLKLTNKTESKAVFNTSLNGFIELALETRPDAESIVINVLDEDVKLSSFGNMSINGQTGPSAWSKVIWNFPKAKTLDFSGLSWKGSVLAPLAELKLANGNIEGQVITRAATLGSGSGEFHSYPFIGLLPTVALSTPDPTPTTPPTLPPTTTVPEPSAIAALALLAGGTALLRRRK